MRLVGIDYGRKRVGVAMSDEKGEFALPQAVWPNTPNLVHELAEYCREKKAEGVVIGESRDLNGRPNEILEDIFLLKQALERELPIAIYLEPEFYTSAEAQRVQGKNAKHDASAAALILKSFLDKKNNGNNRRV